MRNWDSAWLLLFNVCSVGFRNGVAQISKDSVIKGSCRRSSDEVEILYWCEAPSPAFYILLHQKAAAISIFAGPESTCQDLSIGAIKCFYPPWPLRKPLVFFGAVHFLRLLEWIVLGCKTQRDFRQELETIFYDMFVSHFYKTRLILTCTGIKKILLLLTSNFSLWRVFTVYLILEQG